MNAGVVPSVAVMNWDSVAYVELQADAVEVK
jgi:hypothetical protein